LTAHERVRILAELGFTERQAGFLELVMRHAGVCVPRQYARFAGIAHGGEKCNAFFSKLVRRGCAVRSDCLHNRARLYHIHHKPLYQAIGEGESRFRRPVPARRAVERLMLLDAVLVSPDLHWLTTEAEKVSYLAELTPPETVDDSPKSSPDMASQRLVRPFSSAFPIGITANGQAVVFYLATVPWTDEFRTFVQAHTAFLRRVPSWTFCLVFPRPLDRVYHAYQQVIHEELETPLHHATVAELKWYFEHRQKAAGSPVDTMTQGLLHRGAQAFSTPRFTLLYRRWQKHGNSVFDGVSSSVLAEALAGGAGRVESLVLPHVYRHLSPLASLVRSKPERVEKGEQGGEEGSARPQPPPSTPPRESLTISEQLTRDWRRLVGRS
jgi:hypothetical protein